MVIAEVVPALSMRVGGAGAAVRAEAGSPPFLPLDGTAQVGAWAAAVCWHGMAWQSVQAAWLHQQRPGSCHPRCGADGGMAHLALPLVLQVDPTHWVMDVAALAGTVWKDLKEVALFLTAPGALPPDAALALYVSSSGAPSCCE